MAAVLVWWILGAGCAIFVDDITGQTRKKGKKEKTTVDTMGVCALGGGVLSEKEGK